LGDAFQQAGYASVWQRRGSADCVVRGATAGIWDGVQLDNREADDLADFCRALSSDAVPVIAMLDFPRRYSVDRALQIGAKSVLGKPWQHEGLIATIQTISNKIHRAHAA
jgi:DNA-binding response OmpR family regulator